MGTLKKIPFQISTFYEKVTFLTKMLIEDADWTLGRKQYQEMPLIEKQINSNQKQGSQMELCSPEWKWCVGVRSRIVEDT